MKKTIRQMIFIIIATMGFSFSLILIQGCFNDIVIPNGDSDFSANLTTNKKYYKIGENVELTIVLQNITKSSKDLLFNDGQVYDVIVKNASDDKEIWRWSNDKVFTYATWSMVLDPWERKTYNITWDQKDNDLKQVAAGAYKVEVLISSEPEIFAVSKKIVIEDSEAEVVFDTIDKGTQSGYNKRASVLIKDQQKWEEIWNLHTSNLDQVPRIPEIDFKTEMAIAVFRGEFPSSGYSTEVASVVNKNGRLLVIVNETDDINGMVLDVITYPFHIIKLKRSDSSVEFEYRRIIK